VADAGLLADPDGVDGPGPDRRDLPGAQFWKYLEAPRPDAEDRPQGVVLHGRRRNRRARIPRRDRLAGREGLDNLVFVINCNLQRLDGPVRGNGKIIQELEGQFRGAGWNVDQG
jgi:pyruvate dehydrogenase E1 component